MANERLLPGAGLTAFADKGTDDWHLFHDLNMLLLSVLASGEVISRTTVLPAGVNGDIYIVPTGEVNAESIAVFCRIDYGVSGTEQWNYYVPRKGWSFYVTDEGVSYEWDGTTWVPSENVVVGVAVSASRNILATDAGKILDVTTPAAVTLTLQLNATEAIPVGTILNVCRLDATNTLTIASVAGVTINGVDAEIGVVSGAYTEVSLRKQAADAWIIIGDYVV